VTVTGRLAELASAHGVAIEYEDQLRRPVAISADSVIAVLGALGVDATSPAAIDEALREPTPDPPIVVMRQSETRANAGLLHLESGDRMEVPSLPAGLPLGWHVLERDDEMVPVVVAPDRLSRPASRSWGWMVQLYAARSRRSWGMGDLGDLAQLADWTGAHGGDVVLVNPLHAVGPNPPVQPSPYYPASRRWTNPIYVRIEDTPVYRAAPADVRVAVDSLRVRSDGARIDRDAVWSAKLRAFELLWPHAAAFDVSEELRDWATWCAIAEVHGNDWRAWPDELRDGRSPAVLRAAEPERVRFHAWLQMLCQEQLASVQQRAIDAGLSTGIVHDLAVGCDPAGADAWALQDVLALGARIGAPPDPFNQLGQDWGMPPWHPRRLAAASYRPLRDMLRTTLAHAGGIRIDHVLGLFRMWWVPEGGSAADGTYVRYDADALLGIVTLEAERAGAMVIGEDLGTVTKQVRQELASRGVLGTSVLWFERESPRDGKQGPLRPLPTWRANATASVTTHDLPTPLGWLRGEHVRVRAELGLLLDPEAEQAKWEAERAELLAMLVDAGLAGPGATEAELLDALHEAMARTPCGVLLAAPGDLVGEVRQPNLPGTTDEYPSWRLPIADSDGRPVLLDELLADPRVHRLAASYSAAVR
jgi:4-alpha-glucanotransferase